MDNGQQLRDDHVDTFHDRIFEFRYLHLNDVLECLVGREETRTKRARDVFINLRKSRGTRTENRECF